MMKTYIETTVADARIRELKQEIDNLRRQNALLRAVAEAAGIVLESMYGSNGGPFPVEMIPEDRRDNMDLLLAAWGKANDGGALGAE